MARETGVYRRGDSRRWWIATTLTNGRRIRITTGTEDRNEPLAFLAKIKVDAFREANFGIKPSARGRKPFSGTSQASGIFGAITRTSRFAKRSTSTWVV